jgi:hypothetical protein
MLHRNGSLIRSKQRSQSRRIAVYFVLHMRHNLLDIAHHPRRLIEYGAQPQ